MSDEFIAKNLREAWRKGDTICKQNLQKNMQLVPEEEKQKLPFYKLKKNMTLVNTNPDESQFTNANQLSSQFDRSITRINEGIKEDDFSNMSLYNLMSKLKSMKLEKDRSLNNVEAENYTITLEPNADN